LVNDTDLAGIDADDAFLRNLLFDSDWSGFSDDESNQLSDSLSSESD
jgi:hypothetical protein